jgi:hypothetical protein
MKRSRRPIRAVAVFACRPCHRKYDARHADVRIPPSMLEAAETCVRRYEDARAVAGRAVVRLKGKSDGQLA